MSVLSFKDIIKHNTKDISAKMKTKNPKIILLKLYEIIKEIIEINKSNSIFEILLCFLSVINPFSFASCNIWYDSSFAFRWKIKCTALQILFCDRNIFIYLRDKAF